MADGGKVDKAKGRAKEAAGDLSGNQQLKDEGVARLSMSLDGADRETHDGLRGLDGAYDRLIEDGLCVQPRWGTSEEVGRAVVMLSRGDLAYSTGQVLMVDGGWTCL